MEYLDGVLDLRPILHSAMGLITLTFNSVTGKANRLFISIAC